MIYIIKRLFLLLYLLIIIFILEFIFYENDSSEFLNLVNHPSFESLINFLIVPSTILVSFIYLFNIYVTRSVMSSFFRKDKII